MSTEIEQADYSGVDKVAASLPPPREDLPFLNRGDYPDFEVTNIRDGYATRDGRQFIALEGFVRKAVGEEATAVGTKAAIVLKKGPTDTKKTNYFIKDVIKMVAALLNVSPANITSETIMQLVQSAREGRLQPGLHIAVTLEPKNGKTFLNTTFRPATPQ